MRKILVVTRHTPLPWEDGAGAYLFGLLHYLHGAGFEIHVAWTAPHDYLRWKGIWTLPTEFTNIVRLHTPGGFRCGRRQIYPSIYWLPFKARLLARIKRSLAWVGWRIGRPSAASAVPPHEAAPSRLSWMAQPLPSEKAFVAEVVRRVGPDAMIANYAWMTPLFPDPSEACRRVCLHPDVVWRRALHQTQMDGQPLEITRDEEARLLQRAEIIVSISDADRDDHRELAPAAQIIVAPKAVIAQPLALSTTQRLLFVGSGNNFNAEGLEWFLREVWPALLAAVPAITLDVCGSIDRAVTLRPAGVTFHGPVPDLQPLYERAAVVIVPLLRATGLNIKLVDAAAFGRAVVATPVTLIGAPFLREAVLAAETPADFTAAVCRLLQDPAARAAAAERSLAAVRAHLAPDASYGPLAALLRHRAGR